MPVEIRELIIKTEVRTIHNQIDKRIRIQDISVLKNELLEACKQMVLTENKRANYKR